jgi:hypothetical protein
VSKPFQSIAVTIMILSMALFPLTLNSEAFGFPFISFITVELEESMSMVAETGEDFPIIPLATVELEESMEMEGETGEDESSEEQIMMSPRKQMDSGVNAEDVVCKEGLELIIKASSGSAACVKQSTAQVLIQRGWA